jgi:hypothetical protein
VKEFETSPMIFLDPLIGESWEAHFLTSSFDWLTGEARYAHTWRGPAGGGVYYSGNAFYTTASIVTDPIVLTGEYLQEDSFLVEGYGQSYVTLPLVIREPGYTLLSRHLAIINPHEGKAYGGEISSSKIFGTELSASLARIDHPDKAQDYLESYLTGYREWSGFTFKGIYALQKTGEQEPSHNIVIEPLIYFNEKTTILFDLEFQSAEEYSERVSHFYGLSEFSLSPYGSIGVEGGRLMEWDSGKADFAPEYFVRVYIDGTFAENYKITLAYGKRPGGFTCSGGTCRYEPAFEGFELKLLSSF